MEGNERRSKTVSRQLGGGASVARQVFPPDGGVGMRALAAWAWIPAEGVADELLFPRGAEITEAVEVSPEWFSGCYVGMKGVFPANHVRVTGVVTMGGGEEGRR